MDQPNRLIFSSSPQSTLSSVRDDEYLAVYDKLDSDDKDVGERLVGTIASGWIKVATPVICAIAVIGIAAARFSGPASHLTSFIAPAPGVSAERAIGVRAQSNESPRTVSEPILRGQTTPPRDALEPLGERGKTSQLKIELAGRPSDLAKLEARNRRLEALVQVMRQRPKVDPVPIQHSRFLKQ